MNILIFGRGAIGTQYGWAFEKAGHHVDFYVREGKKEQYGDAVELALTDARRTRDKHIRETWHINLKDASDTTPDYDLCLFSVNSEQVNGALSYLAPKIGNATVVFFNNYGGDPLAAVSGIPKDQVVYGFPGAGGGYEGNTLYGMLRKTMELGAVNGELNAREKETKHLFESAGFTVNVRQDLSGWLLSHYLANAAMEAAVLEKGSFQNVVDSKDGLSIMLKSLKETVPYLKAKNTTPDMTIKALSIFPASVMASIIKHTIYVPGKGFYEAIIHNHFKAGYAVKEIVDDARKLGIKMPYMEHALKHYVQG